MGPNFWNKLINYINYIYEDFYKYSEPCVYENLSWLYSQKLLNRKNELEDLLKNKNKLNIGNIYEEKIILNRKIILPSLKNTIIEIFDFLKSFEKNRPLFFGHGDLCFNNILVEPISSSVKLIDPKAFRNPRNNQIGLVDPMYDLAKLNHSFSCLYDSIVNNLFILNKNANEIELFIIKPPNYDVANFYFKNIFGAKIIESETVRLLTSSLFLSMLPLHKENPNRVLALSIVGICLFNNININNLIIKL